MATKGTVKSFSIEKGYGFIQDKQGKAYFFHVKALKNKRQASKIHAGTPVLFDPRPGRRGPAAHQVELVPTIDVEVGMPFTNLRNRKPHDIPAIKKVLYTRQFRSLNDAKDHLETMARDAGANMLYDVQFERDSATEDGRYFFTVFKATGVAAVAGRIRSYTDEDKAQRAHEAFLKQQDEFAVLADAMQQGEMDLKPISKPAAPRIVRESSSRRSMTGESKGIYVGFGFVLLILLLIYLSR